MDTEMEPTIPTPEHLVQKRLKSLPAGIGGVLLTLYSIFQWVSVPASLLSQIADLRVSIELWQSLYARAVALRPFLDRMIEVTTPVFVAWREFTAPLRDFVIMLLPNLSMPQLVVDLLTVFLICLPSIVRVLVPEVQNRMVMKSLEDRFVGASVFLVHGMRPEVIALEQELGEMIDAALVECYRINSDEGARALRSSAVQVARYRDHPNIPPELRDAWNGEIDRLAPLLERAATLVERRQRLRVQLHRSVRFLKFAAALSALTIVFVLVDLLVFER